MKIDIPEKLLSSLEAAAEEEGMSVEEYLETTHTFFSSSTKINVDVKNDREQPHLIIEY